MIRTVEKRENKGYEVQWYNHGNNSHVTQCDTAVELAQVLARACWGSARFGDNPTIWLDGKRWCYCTYDDAK